MGAEAQLFGSILSAGGAYSSAKGAKAGYKAQAAIARNNAKYLEWEAEDALARGARAEQGVRLRTAGVKSDQRAAFAARGLDMGYGSALDILTDTDYMGDVDAKTERNNAAREAWGKRQQARGALNDAALLASQAKAISPTRAAFTSLLTNAKPVADSWNNTSWGKGSTSKPSWDPRSPIGDAQWS